MSDSRLDGVVSSMWDWDERLFGEQVEVAVGGFRIEHADGAWQMRPMVNFTLPDGTYPTSTGIFDGEDDYEGLTGTAEVIEGRTAYRLRGIAIEGEIRHPRTGCSWRRKSDTCAASSSRPSEHGGVSCS